MNNDVCSICEVEFERNDLEYVQLRNNYQGYEQPGDPKAFYACANCAMREKLNWYHTRFIEIGESAERGRTESNLFRTLMMNVETMESLGAEGQVSVRSYIMQHRVGWEKLPLDTLMLFLDLYQKHAEEFASIINKKASKEEIQASLVARTKKAQKAVVDAVKAEKVEKTGLVGEYTKDEQKAIKGLMNGPLKLSETKAVEMIRTVMSAVRTNVVPE